MRREWELEDLIECWTLDEEEFALLANKFGATRLGFGLMLKFFELEARDEDKLADWLATKICPVEMSRDRLRNRLRGALLARCREDRIEPPKTTRIERVLGAAEAMFERNFTATTVERLSFESVGKLEELIVADVPPAGVPVAGEDAPAGDGQPPVASGGRRAFLQELKEDPGSFQLDTLLAEIVKLERVSRRRRRRCASRCWPRCARCGRRS